MINLSSKHHYIPKFYLQNFTNQEGEFYIYLVKENRFKKRGQLFSPKSHFYVQDGNSFFGENFEKDDHLENSYSDLDNKFAELFSKINSSVDVKSELTDADMPLLQFFVAHLYWRNPLNDVTARSLLAKTGLKSTGMIVKNTTTNEIVSNSEFEKALMNNDHAYKIVKHAIPYTKFKELLENKTPLQILTFESQKPSLISDNPIIFRTSENVNVYRDDFILPIANYSVPQFQDR